MVNNEFAYLQLSYQQRNMRVAVSRGPRQCVHAHQEQHWLGPRDGVRADHKLVPYSATIRLVVQHLGPSIPSSFALTRALTGGPSQQETSSSFPNPNSWIRSHDTRGRRRPPTLCSPCRSPRPPLRQRRRQGWRQGGSAISSSIRGAPSTPPNRMPPTTSPGTTPPLRGR
jgi:hypothetical protein